MSLPRNTARRTHRRQGGFTLVELLVVMAVLGLLLRTVVANYRADIPIIALRANATAIAAKLDYLRTESRLEGGRYGMEIDIQKQRYRILLPPERRKPKEDEKVLEGRNLSWTSFEEGVRLTGVDLSAKEDTKRDQRIQILFDERGRTQQKVLFFKHREDPELVYSVMIPPLAGAVEAKNGQHGFKTATDLDF